MTPMCNKLYLEILSDINTIDLFFSAALSEFHAFFSLYLKCHMSASFFICNGSRNKEKKEGYS